MMPDEITPSTNMASSFSDASIESLPIEINLLLFSRLHTLADVYSLIRASPIHHAVFRSDRSRILDGALNRSYYRVNLLLALAVSRIEKLSELTPYARTAWGSIDTHEKLMRSVKDHLKGRGKHLVYDSWLFTSGSWDWEEGWVWDEATLMPLCRLWMLTDHFIGHFVRDVHGRWLSSGISVGDKREWMDSTVDLSYRHGLSKNEYNRMGRGFLYFEMYCRMFGGVRSPYTRQDAEHDYLYHEQKVFVSSLTYPEAGAIFTVIEYLTRCMADTFDRINGYTRHRFDQLLKQAKSNLKDDNSESAGKNRLQEIRRVLQNRKRRQPEVFNYMIELGLPFCRRFFRMDTADQTRMAHQYSARECKASLATALNYFHVYLRDPSEKYYWDHIDVRTSSTVAGNFTCNFFISAQLLIGHFVWDKDRVLDIKSEWDSYLKLFKGRLVPEYRISPTVPEEVVKAENEALKCILPEGSDIAETK